MLIIVRGLPGSGKSTFAKLYVEKILETSREAVHLEADQFHINKAGEYDYDSRRANEAHADCLMRAIQAIDDGKIAVVSNTFAAHWSFKPYLAVARAMKIKSKVFVCKGKFESIHGVPAEVIEKMAEAWEPWGGEEVVGVDEE